MASFHLVHLKRYIFLLRDLQHDMELGVIRANIDLFYSPDIHPVTRNEIVGLVDHHYLFIMV